MAMPRFSLIVATVNRTEEFSRLLHTLAAQQMNDFELIVVDQNSDDRLFPLLREWASWISERDGSGGLVPVKHLRTGPGVSRARNLGLTHSSGDIIAFPDDDCWYLCDTLQNVSTWFEENAGYGILSVGSKDGQGRTSGNRLGKSACDLNRFNLFRASSTYGFFVRRPLGPTPLKFDESLGPGSGTRFGAGEDTDFLLTLMSHGIRGRFYPALHVGHP